MEKLFKTLICPAIVLGIMVSIQIITEYGYKVYKTMKFIKSIRDSSDKKKEEVIEVIFGEDSEIKLKENDKKYIIELIRNQNPHFFIYKEKYQN